MPHATKATPKKSNNTTTKPDKNKSTTRRNAKNKPSTITPPSHMTTYTTPPRNWPSNYPYLSTSHQDSLLTPAQLSLLHPTTLPADAYKVPSLCTYSPTSNPLITITAISTPSHPAFGQHGLFAPRPLAPGTHILDYTGLLHSCPLPSCSTSDYDLAFLDRDASLAIDGQSMGSEARFINDYHGVSEKGPNAVFEEYFVRVKGKGGKEMWEARMGVWVSPKCEGIAKGEEVLLSYGRGYWRARGLGDLRMQEEGRQNEVDVEDARGG
jgi:hypothetical protein